MPIKITNLSDELIRNKIPEIEEGATVELSFYGSSDNLVNFDIKIGFDYEREDKNYSTQLKELCEMKFIPYDYKTRVYHFYTSRYTKQNQEYRIQLLEDILNLTKKQILKNKETQNKTEDYFTNNFHKTSKFETDNLVCIPIKDEGKLIAIPKKFLNPEGFSKYRKVSSDYKKTDSLNVTNFEYLQKEAGKYFKPNTGFFVIDKKTFLEFMTFTQDELSAKESYVEEQKKVGDKIELNKYNINQKNPFDLKINYIEDKGYFEFYCKGFVDSITPFGDLNERGLLGRWALNFILGTNNEDFATERSYFDLKLTGKEKINLTCLPTSSAKERTLHIPADQYLKIEEIYNSYENEKKLWERNTVQIRLPFRSLNIEEVNDHYPFIYFKEDGQALFIFNTRHSNIKSKTDFMSLKGFEINKEEVHNFLFEHPFGEKILDGTKLVLCCLSQPGLLSEENKTSIFEKTYEMYKLRNELSKETTTRKKMKI